MTRTKPWREIRRDVEDTPAARARGDALTRAMEDALALGRLREARGTTQVEPAGVLGVTQANVSRIEHQDDLYLSTLREYVEALGGRLQIAAIFDDQTILLTPPGLQPDAGERPATVREPDQRDRQEGDVSVSARSGGRK